MMETRHISKDKKYQYTYKQIWDESKPILLYICLNPPLSNKDNSLECRLKDYTLTLGFGGFYLCNLFAYRSDKFMPLTVMGKDQAIGKHNNKWLERIAKKCEYVVFAWGINGKTYRRCDEVMAMFPKAKTLGPTDIGYPQHIEFINKSPKLMNYGRK